MGNFTSSSWGLAQMKTNGEADSSQVSGNCSGKAKERKRVGKRDKTGLMPLWLHWGNRRWNTEKPAAAAAALMNHSARLGVYTSCDMSFQPACPSDVTLHAWRRVISAVFVRAVSESRNRMANEPAANELLNHHSAVAKDQPSSFDGFAPKCRARYKKPLEKRWKTCCYCSCWWQRRVAGIWCSLSPSVCTWRIALKLTQVTGLCHLLMHVAGLEYWLIFTC